MNTSQNHKNLSKSNAALPESLLNLPEKVLQFGTGVLLRGLPDYFINKANQQGIFNGRIVVVKSTDGGGAEAFDRQDNLYTICEREWDAILECAKNPDLQIITSNTTEVGIQLVQDDIKQSPPISFPGKVLAFLHAISFPGKVL
eukprot:gene15245-18629_t